MAEDTRDPHVRIAAQLRAEIMAGTPAPGEALLSTKLLGERFGVAGSTIQKAVKRLVKEGYIEGENGVSRRVRLRPNTVVDVGPYFVPQPGRLAYDILAVEEQTPPPHVAAILGDGSAILRKRLMTLDGAPAEVNHAWYPAEIARGTALAGVKKMKGGAPQVLAELGYPQRRMVDQVSARLPVSEEFEMLDLTDGVPVLRQFRVIYSDHDVPVEVAVMVKAAHLFELRYPSIPLD